MLRTVVSLSAAIALLATCGIGNAQLKKLRTGTTIGEIKSVTAEKQEAYRRTSPSTGIRFPQGGVNSRE